MFSILGDVILDPFLGSGTTLKVAMDLDRKFVGYEKLPQLTDIIKRKVGSNGRVEFLEPGRVIKEIVVSRET
jgi:DNA modification methylase